MPELPGWMWKVMPVAFVVGLVLAANGWLGPLSTLVPVLLVVMLLRRMPRGDPVRPDRAAGLRRRRPPPVAAAPEDAGRAPATRLA